MIRKFAIVVVAVLVAALTIITADALATPSGCQTRRSGRTAAGICWWGDANDAHRIEAFAVPPTATPGSPRWFRGPWRAPGDTSTVTVPYGWRIGTMRNGRADCCHHFF